MPMGRWWSKVKKMLGLDKSSESERNSEEDSELLAAKTRLDGLEARVNTVTLRLKHREGRDEYR